MFGQIGLLCQGVTPYLKNLCDEKRKMQRCGGFDAVVIRHHYLACTVTVYIFCWTVRSLSQARHMGYKSGKTAVLP